MSNSYRKYFILIAIISVILGVIVTSVYFLNSFHLLEAKPILLSQEYRGYTENNHSGKTKYDYMETIDFYYIGGGTTSNDCIQVRKKDNTTKKEIILGTFEKYKILVSYCFNGDSLTLVLKQNFDFNLDCDTYTININDIKHN